MAKVDPVIAALRIVLHEVETRRDAHWDTHVFNRWIDRLPGPWARRWQPPDRAGAMRDVPAVGISLPRPSAVPRDPGWTQQSATLSPALQFA
jgi:hypothetical protein